MTKQEKSNAENKQLITHSILYATDISQGPKFAGLE